MDAKKILAEIRDNIEAVIRRDTPTGKSLWEALIELHPVDIAEFLPNMSLEHAWELFRNLPKKLKLEVFEEASDSIKVGLLEQMDDHERIEAFKALSADEIADVFELLTDEELKKYLNLLHKKAREKVLSLLQFPTDSAGSVMHTDVFTLMEDFTTEQSIKLLQRVRPDKDVHQKIYVTDKSDHLLGYINLQDLLLESPETRISKFMVEDRVVVRENEDQESVAKKMVKYNLTIVPVVDKNNHFLGVIPSETLADILVEEAGEDIQRMAAVTPLKYPYFKTSYWRILWERGYILITLLAIESLSTMILEANEATLTPIPLLLALVPMLISVGGNTSNQTSAIAIQGMASGEISNNSILRFLKREFLMAAGLSFVLGLTAFMRVYFTSGRLAASLVVSFALSIIVIVSVILGSGTPFLLRRLNLDPAFAAGPFLATVMDILGILIYCYIVKVTLF